MLEIRTLENTSIREITDTFNMAFSDYSLPIVFKEEQFIDKFATEGGRLDLSVGVFENNSMVGFILHFLDVKQGETYIYNGGTGVIPTHRGKQLTTKMYDFIVPKLKEAQVDRLILEVFTDNLSALKIYQNRGFQIQREVACFSGKPVKVNAKLGSEYELLELKDPNWEQLSSFWDYPPTWQNSISTVNNMLDRLMFLGVKKENEVLGYLAFNPKLGRIHQMAIAQKHRNKGIGSALINSVIELKLEKVSFINIDVRTTHIKSFLEKRGLNNYVNQFEMEKGLD